MLAARTANPEALIGGGDAVHPGPPGQTLMAWIVLKGLGASAAVSSAEIQANTRSAKTRGCTVENLTFFDGGVSFDRLDTALPMPIDSRAESALKLAPILDELSRYSLQVVGLPEGAYQIAVDGETCAKATAGELAQGINLSIQAGPITQQARDLLGLVFQKNNRYFERWRSVQLYAPPGWVAGPELEARRETELKRLDAEIAADEARIDALRTPRKHRFEIKRIPA